MEVRPYDHDADFRAVLDLLPRWHRPGAHVAVWHQARWSYMHAHPNVDVLDFTRFGVAADREGIVGVVHQEHAPAFAHLQVAPGRDDTIPPLLDWAEERLGGWSQTLGTETLGFWVRRCRTQMADEIRRRGYELTDYTEPDARIDLGRPPEPAPLPEGYRLATLADDNDLAQVNRVLWRGFNHPGEPPATEIPGRARGQSAPGFRLDRTVVAVAPSGEFAAYAGIWLDEANRSAYVEPVATDPDHRRRGLGRAAVQHALELARQDGATHAWVGSDQEFYLSMGFEVTCTADLWLRPS